MTELTYFVLDTKELRNAIVDLLIATGCTVRMENVEMNYYELVIETDEDSIVEIEEVLAPFVDMG